MNKTVWKVIVSRKSGGGKAFADWPYIAELLDERGFDYSASITEYAYHAIELAAQSYKEGYRNFLVVGGDGAVHEVLNGLFSCGDMKEEKITLGIIPVGSGNDWARLYRIPADYAAAVKVITRVGQKFVKQDVAKVTTMMDGLPYSRYMVNIGGLGFDSFVCHKYELAKSRGHASDAGYYKALLSSFFTYKPLDFEIRVDGRDFYKGNALSVALGIGKYCGGGMMQTPGAVSDDGLIDLTVIHDMKKIKFLSSLSKLYNGTIYDLEDNVLFTRGKRLEIKASPYSYMEVDGELVGVTPVTVEIIPAAINVISNI